MPGMGLSGRPEFKYETCEESLDYFNKAIE